MTCDGCRFCCWSFNVPDVPDPVKKLEYKPARTHCSYECNKGCSIHGLNKYPEACEQFECPYLEGAYIHRPDEFQELLEEIYVQVGNFIPAIPPHIPVKIAEELIREDRSLPAFILIGNQWVKVILSLDREDAKSWIVKDKSVERWSTLFEAYGAPIDSTVEPGTLMVG